MPAEKPSMKRKLAQTARIVEFRRAENPEARARMLATAEREVSAYKAKLAFDRGDLRTFVSISIQHNQLPVARLALKAVMLKGLAKDSSFIARNRKKLVDAISLVQQADQKAAEDLMRTLRELER